MSPPREVWALCPNHPVSQNAILQEMKAGDGPHTVS